MPWNAGTSFAQDGAYAEQDHRDGDAELEALGDGQHQVVADAAGAAVEGLEGGGLTRAHQVDDGDHQVHQHHRQGGGNHGIAEEAQRFGDLDVFGGAALAFRVDQAPHRTRSDIAGGSEVSDGDGVVAGDATGPGLGERGQRDHEDAQQDRAEHDDDRRGHARRSHHDGDQGGHEQQMMAGEEDVAQWRESGQQDRHDEAQDHQPRHLGTELGLSDTSDRLIGGHDALGAECALDHDAQRRQGGRDQRRASPDEKEAEDCFDRAAGDLPDGLTKGDQADGGDDADQISGNAEDFIDEELCD